MPLNIYQQPTSDNYSSVKLLNFLDQSLRDKASQITISVVSNVSTSKHKQYFYMITPNIK